MVEELDLKRRSLHEENIASWDGSFVLKTESKLDSSLKKNTTFIKKLKTSFNNDQCQSIVKDIQKISLEKYMSELISSATEGIIKINKGDDLTAMMSIISALHQRFTHQFTPSLLSNLIIALSESMGQVSSTQENDKEEQAKTIRQKNLLRVITELYLIGIFRTFNDCERSIIPDSINKKYDKYTNDPIVVLIFKDILAYNIKLGNSLSIVQVFIKRFNHIIYDDSNMLMTNDTRLVIKAILEKYASVMFENLAQLNKKLIQVAERYKKSTIRTGKILDEHLDEYNRVKDLFEKFKVGCQYLSDFLRIPMPELGMVKNSNEEAVVEVVKNVSLNEDDMSVWESPSEKNFYTKIPLVDELSKIHSEAEYNDSTGGEKVVEFVNNLDKINDESDLEKLVVGFSLLNLNNKATRNRLMKFFIETYNNNNLKYFAKFLKIYEVELKDLINDLIEYLDKGFRSQIYHNKLNLKNIFFFVELTKFKLIPTHIIFHKIRSLTVNINATNNIDILSVFYENIGRFLLNEPEYRDFMLQMIELLKEKQKIEKLSINDKLAVNNLLIIIDPPVTKVASLHSQRKYSNIEKFLMRLLRVELNQKSLPIILSVLKKIDLSTSTEAYNMLLEIFEQPELLNYENIAHLALVLHSLSKLNKNLLVKTIDSIVDKIIRDLELNDYRSNRLRISQVKFLAEMFNTNLLNFKFINDLLYKIICYGHPNNQPLPQSEVEIDTPNNYFRIQLCCIVLLSLKSLGNSSNQIKTGDQDTDSNIDLLRTFFVFFHYYIFCKEQPVPVEIQFKIEDVFFKYSTIEGIKRPMNLMEAVNDLKEIAQKRASNKQVQYFEDDDNDDNDNDNEPISFELEEENGEEDDGFSDISSVDSDEDSDDNLDSDSITESEIEDESETDEESNSDSQSESESESESDSDGILGSDLDTELSRKFQSKPSEEDKKFSEELDREFQKIIVDSYEQRSSSMAVKGKLNIPIPNKSLMRAEQNGNDKKFSLMTRNGKKLNFASVNLKTDNKFAENLLKEKADQQQHKERTMNLILNMKD